MAKQFTRNYDNLFALNFGCINTTYTTGGKNGFENPTFKRFDGVNMTAGTNRREPQAHAAHALTIPAPTALAPVKDNGSSISYSSGIYANTALQIGTGAAPVSYEDYCLSSPITDNVSLGTVISSYTYDTDTHIYTKVYKCPILYSGANDITISEFGIFVTVPYANSSNINYSSVLVYREILDTPVTLSQNDTIEITFSQSIAQPNYTPYPTE